MAIATGTCETCDFYRKVNEFGGQCYRHPPVPVCQVSFDGSGASMYDSLRPWVVETDFCGEYR